LFLYFFGINVSSFQYKDILVNGLYIKLDKKLIVKVDKLKIPILNNSLNSSNSLDNIQKDLELIPLLKKYFTLIDIKELTIGSQHMIVSYNNEYIYFDNNLVNISLKPKFNKNTIDLNLYSLYLKDYEMMFDGNIKLDLLKQVSFLYGNFYYKDIEGTISSIVNKKQIDFHIDSSSMKDIKFVRDFITLPSKIESWMYDNVSGQFKLNYLIGTIDISKDKIKLVKLKGDAQVKDASIIYHKNLKPIKTKLLAIKYENDNLYFNMKEPTYEGIKVYGSDVVISSLMGKQPNIAINIKTKNKLTKDIVKIVQAFGANIPVEQLNGVTDSQLTIKIDLYGKFKKNLTGIFKTKNSIFKIDNFKFKALDATVKLHNNTLKILDALVLYDKNLKMKLNLDIDLKNKKAIGKISNLNYILKNDKYTFVDLKKISSNVKINFKKSFNIDIDKLNLSILQNKKTLKIKLNNLKKVYPYSPFLKEFNLKNGSLVLDIYSKNKLNFQANIYKLDLPLIYNSKKLDSLVLNGKINGSTVKISSKNNLIRYTNTPNSLKLKNIDIVYDTNQNIIGNDLKSIKIDTINSNIIIDKKYKLLSDSLHIDFVNNKLKFLTNKYKTTSIKYQNIKNSKTIIANNITPEFFKALTNKEFIKTGTIDLNAKGKKDILDGAITINNVLLEPKAKATIKVKDKKENTTIDSYLIKYGKIHYRYNLKTKYLDMYDIKTKGDGLDLAGSMNFNFTNNNINGALNASFLKGASEVIGKIPLFNYILLGDEQSFSVKVKVKGTFDNMQISTNTASSAVKAPISILKRIITLPVKAIETIKDSTTTNE